MAVWATKWKMRAWANGKQLRPRERDIRDIWL